jgi:CDP-diacylglycerol--glycerol-3-phosphate 3-phosphatidyltransferase
VFIYASIKGDFTAAFILFVGAAFTDMFDGMIARRFNQRSRLGAILDPIADKTMLVCGYVFYTLYDNVPLVRIPGWLTFAVFIRDFLIALFAYLVWTRVHVTRFPPSWAGKLSTVLQAATLGVTIGVNAFVPSLLWLAQLLFRVALVVTLYSAWDYLRRGKRMLEEGFAAAA